MSEASILYPTKEKNAGLCESHEKTPETQPSSTFRVSATPQVHPRTPLENPVRSSEPDSLNLSQNGVKQRKGEGSTWSWQGGQVTMRNMRNTEVTQPSPVCWWAEQSSRAVSHTILCCPRSVASTGPPKGEVPQARCTLCGRPSKWEPEGFTQRKQRATKPPAKSPSHTCPLLTPGSLCAALLPNIILYFKTLGRWAEPCAPQQSTSY